MSAPARPAGRAHLVRWGAMGVIGVTAVLAVVFASRFGLDPSIVTSPLIGRPAPDLTLAALDGGEPVHLADLRGEIVVVNFFASWCLPCRTEHADLVATADAYAGQGVQFLGVTYQDRPEDARAFLDELGWSTATRYLVDPRSEAAIALGVFGVPETFLIAPDGTVVGRIQGESNALLLGQAIEAIRRGERPGQQVVGEVQSGPGG
ncbi:MAG: TlpA family protein disulfide reductase [Acidimicrobiia bacterium]